jgi:hypothetical protein
VSISLGNILSTHVSRSGEITGIGEPARRSEGLKETSCMYGKIKHDWNFKIEDITVIFKKLR